MKTPCQNLIILRAEDAFHIYRTLQKFNDKLSTYAGDKFISPDHAVWFRCKDGSWQGLSGMMLSTLELSRYCAELAIPAA